MEVNERSAYKARRRVCRYRAECTPSTKMYVRSVGGLAGLVAARHGGPEKFDGMKDLAAAANHVVLDVLNDINQLPFNIITTDFVSDQVSQWVCASGYIHCVPKKVSPLNILQQPPQTCTDLNEILHTQDDIYFCHRRQIS